MAFTKINAAGIGSTETVTLDGLTVINDGSFGGNVSVGGTLTYEDVTNIDSVGLITARAGVVVGSGITLSKDGDIFATGITTVSGNVKVGTGITLSPDGDGFFTGVITATSYSGIDLSNVTGAQGDFSIVDKIVHTGDTDTAIRFSGADTVSVEVAGNEKIRIDDTYGLRILSQIYMTDSVPLYLGNANDFTLLHDGTDCRIRFNHAVGDLKFQNNSNSNLMVLDASGRLLLGTTTEGQENADDLTVAGSSNSGITIRSGTSSFGQLFFSDGTSDLDEYRGIVGYSHADNFMKFHTDAVERLRIDSSGRVMIGDDAATGAALLQVQKSSGDMVLVRNHDTNYESLILSVASGTSDIVASSGGSTSRPALRFITNDAERLRIDSSGRILVAGGDSYHADADDLVLKERSGGNVGMTLQNTTNGFGVIYFADAASTTVGRIQYDHGNDSLDFYTGGSERMSISGSGVNFGANQTFSSNDSYYIGTNTAKAARLYSTKFIHREGNGGSTTSGGQNAEVIMFDGNGITMMHDSVTLTTEATFSSMTASRGGQLLRMRNNGGGAIYSESGSISSASDYRIKENVAAITSAISIVKTLNPVSYNIKKSWNPEDDGVREHGFIAHEVAESIPNIKNIASGVKDAMNEDGSIDAQGVDYSRMTPVLTAAIKELIAEVETLKAEVAALKG